MSIFRNLVFLAPLAIFSSALTFAGSSQYPDVDKAGVDQGSEIVHGNLDLSPSNVTLKIDQSFDFRFFYQHVWVDAGVQNKDQMIFQNGQLMDTTEGTLEEYAAIRDPYCVIEAERGHGLLQFNSKKIAAGRTVSNLSYKIGSNAPSFEDVFTQSQWNNLDRYSRADYPYENNSIVFSMGAQKNQSPKITALKCVSPKGPITASQIRKALGSMAELQNLDSLFQSPAAPSQSATAMNKAASIAPAPSSDNAVAVNSNSVVAK